VPVRFPRGLRATNRSTTRAREAAFAYFGRLGPETENGRITEGAEHFRDLYAWDEFWS
jgi:hypothetical protein